MLGRVVAAMVVIAAAAVACSTFSGSDDDVSGGDSGSDAATPGDGATGDGDSSAPDGDLPDAGNDADAGTPCDLVRPVGVFYSASFDISTCEGWGVSNGAIMWVAAPRRCGAGACKVCSTGAAQPLLGREVPVTTDGGTIQLDFQIYGDTISPDWVAGVDVIEDGGTATNGSNVGTMTKGQWSPAQVIVQNTRATVQVNVRIYTTPDAGPGECFYIDEPTIAHY